MTADKFSLRDLIREVAAETNTVNTDKLADEIHRRTPAACRNDAYLQALGYAVRMVIHEERRHTQIRPDNATTHGDASVTPIRQGPAWKRDGIREYWRLALTQKYSVGDGDSVALADLNRAQVKFNVEKRRDLAARSSAKADQMQGLYELMIRHDVYRVGDLPEPVLAAILVRAA